MIVALTRPSKRKFIILTRLYMYKCVEVTGNDKIHMFLVCQLSPFVIFAIQPTPFRLMHHYDPERRI